MYEVPTSEVPALVGMLTTGSKSWAPPPSVSVAARQLRASARPSQADLSGLGRRTLLPARRRQNGMVTRKRLGRAEGEGFEPSIRLTTDNGFRDRRIRPLCHPSAFSKPSV